MAVVRNGSLRPIRDVTCRLSPLPGRDYECTAAKVAELTTLPVSDVMQLPFSSQPQNIDRLAMIRAGQCFEFRFAVPVTNCPDAKIRLRFTDDADLHWQIDSDLHLEFLTVRPW